MEIARMDIKEINFAIDILSHPQQGDESDIDMALNIAVKSLKAWKDVIEQESKRRYSMSFNPYGFANPELAKKEG